METAPPDEIYRGTICAPTPSTGLGVFGHLPRVPAFRSADQSCKIKPEFSNPTYNPDNVTVGDNTCSSLQENVREGERHGTYVHAETEPQGSSCASRSGETAQGSFPRGYKRTHQTDSSGEDDNRPEVRSEVRQSAGSRGNHVTGPRSRVVSLRNSRVDSASSSSSCDTLETNPTNNAKRLSCGSTTSGGSVTSLESSPYDVTSEQLPHRADDTMSDNWSIVIADRNADTVDSINDDVSMASVDSNGNWQVRVLPREQPRDSNAVVYLTDVDT